MDRQRLRDGFGRTIEKLRISVTDRCSLRCIYCMPLNPDHKRREEILTFEEIRRLASVFVKGFGVGQIRITGGEPLERSRLDSLVAELASLRRWGLRRISLTTNGSLLAPRASTLRRAGLDDVNVSIDSIRPLRFRKITSGDLRDVLDGIGAALEAGLEVKINTVLIRRVNDDEIVDLVEWASGVGVTLRFIEFMPLDGKGMWKPELVVREEEILKTLRRRYTVEYDPATRPSDPARYYVLDGRYRVGVLPTTSNPFCMACNRVRLTTDGKLFACLYSPRGYDLRGPLRMGADDEELSRLVAEAVRRKPVGYIGIAARKEGRYQPMYYMGG